MSKIYLAIAVVGGSSFSRVTDIRDRKELYSFMCDEYDDEVDSIVLVMNGHIGRPPSVIDSFTVDDVYGQ